MSKPITERSNPITAGIDAASPKEIVELLEECDREMLNGWQSYTGLKHESTIHMMEKLVDKAAAILKDPDNGAIVMSGCGTSGRLAFITSRTFNAIMESQGHKPCFEYIMAGGDKALFTSEEFIEDDPPAGMEELEKVVQDKKDVLFIGITCGLSSPFVAGQLYHCVQNLDKYTPVLLGFNPTDLARNIPIEKWDKTFLQVVEKMKPAVDNGDAFILNPILGPEAITGSSRMKGASATKILLESIFVSASIQVVQPLLSIDLQSFMKCYEHVVDAVYSSSENIARLAKCAGDSLNAGGHIYYLGWDSLGIMAMIDASECVPTFGSAPDDVLGFLDGGFQFLKNKEGDITDKSKGLSISLQHFQEDVLPELQEKDLTVLLTRDITEQQLELTRGLKSKHAIIQITTGSNTNKAAIIDNDAAEVVNVVIPLPDITKLIPDVPRQYWEQMFCELSAKLVCNAISTAAHILKGKVYENIMIDLNVSNNKLYYRAVGIIERCTKLSADEAREFLLRSIYNTDTLTTFHYDAPISQHIETATPVKKVIPVAILSATLKCSVEEARKQLAAQPILRTFILQSLQQ